MFRDLRGKDSSSASQDLRHVHKVSNDRARVDGPARYLEEIRKFPMLEPGEEFMLAKRWQEHADQDAAEKLVTSHLRLVARSPWAIAATACRSAS